MAPVAVPDVSSRREQAPEQQVPDERALHFARDIYYMKLVAIEVVVQLALDTVAANPARQDWAAQVKQQIEEELEHLDASRQLLDELGAFETAPAFTGAFSRLMRHHARRRHRRLPLAVATILCTAVETHTMQALAAVPATRLGSAASVFRKLAEDETEHHELIANGIAPDAARHAGGLERLHANLIVLEIAAITVPMWWRQRVKDLAALGADAPATIRAILDDAERTLLPLGVRFPRPLMDRLMDRMLNLEAVKRAGAPAELIATPR